MIQKQASPAVKRYCLLLCSDFGARCVDFKFIKHPIARPWERWSIFMGSELRVSSCCENFGDIGRIIMRPRRTTHSHPDQYHSLKPAIWLLTAVHTVYTRRTHCNGPWPCDEWAGAGNLLNQLTHPSLNNEELVATEQTRRVYPIQMHTVLFCFVWLWICHHSLQIRVMHLHISSGLRHLIV